MSGCTHRRPTCPTTLVARRRTAGAELRGKFCRVKSRNVQRYFLVAPAWVACASTLNGLQDPVLYCIRSNARHTRTTQSRARFRLSGARATPCAPCDARASSPSSREEHAPPHPRAACQERWPGAGGSGRIAAHAARGSSRLSRVAVAVSRRLSESMKAWAKPSDLGRGDGSQSRCRIVGCRRRSVTQSRTSRRTPWSHQGTLLGHTD